MSAAGRCDPLRREISRSVCGLLLSVVASIAAGAQATPVGSRLEDFARLLQLTGDLPFSAVTQRSGTIEQGASPIAEDSVAWGQSLRARLRAQGPLPGERFALLPQDLRIYHNSTRPWGVNDGAVWQGKGSTLALSAGVHGRLGPLQLTFAPLLTHSRNADFALSPWPAPDGHSPFAYPTFRPTWIDSPQRFGSRPVTTLDWGQSSVRAAWRGTVVGFSNENLWWGPGVRNALLMTNNAPGFPHLFAGTTRPANIGIGTLDARVIWGSLRESAYFDTVSTNDRRFITGAVLSHSPSWAPTLEVGLARVFQQGWQAGPSLEDAFLLLHPGVGDGQDEMTSVFLRWVAPESKLELYGEWAKGEQSGNPRDLMVQPEYGSGWLLGFQKAMQRGPSEKTLWRLTSELTLLGAARTTRIRTADAGFFYVHPSVVQGYTHRGQVMGAGIGPGSSQAFVRLDRFAAWGSAGISAFRTVYDNDRFYLKPGTVDRRGHEVEPAFAANVLIVRGPWDLSFSAAASQLLNQYGYPLNDHWNANIVLGAAYHPRTHR